MESDGTVHRAAVPLRTPTGSTKATGGGATAVCGTRKAAERIGRAAVSREGFAA